MFIFVAVNFLVIPLVILVHPTAAPIVHGFLVPGAQGGMTSTAVLLIIAIVGTTVAPWQLFFQQSNIVDKRITPRWINYERADTVIGSFVVVVAATALVVTAAFGLQGTPLAGHFTNAGDVARGLEKYVGHGTGPLFALVLLNASIIGAAAVTLSTSYAVGDMFGIRHSLHRSVKDAKQFYIIFTGLVVLAAAIVLVPGAPLGLITTSVQALAGVLLPSATVFLLLLCNDKQVLGPWVNRPWLNVLAGFIVAVLLALSLILMATTVFPSLNVDTLALVLGGIIATGFLALGIWALLPAQRAKRHSAREARIVAESHEPEVRRDTWRMPPLALLQRPVWSRGRTFAMWTLRIYLVAAVLLLFVKAVQIGAGH
jgi:Mn2+/Fe2+ NRAMP family transporter